MDHKLTVFTTILSNEDLRSTLKQLLDIMAKLSTEEVDIMFGFAWGLEYKDWTPFRVQTSAVLMEIQKAEELKVGSLGHDDFHLIFDDLQTEIIICHESDIHLNYNTENNLTSNMMNYFDSRNLVAHIKTV